MWAVRTAFGQAGALWRGRSNVGWKSLARRALRGALRRSTQSVLAQLRGILEGELEGIRGAGTWKSERVIMSRQGPHIHVDGVSGGILNLTCQQLPGPEQPPRGDSGRSAGSLELALARSASSVEPQASTRI